MAKKFTGTTRNTARIKITWRYILVSSLIVVFACWIAFDLFSTTVVDADKWIEKANKELEVRDTIAPLRGDILAADGSVLATNLNYYTLRIDFKASKFSESKFRESLDELCDTLAKNHPVRTRDQWKQYLSAELEKEPAKRNSSFTLLKNLTYAQSEAVKNYPFFNTSTNPNKTGLTCEKVIKRCYPYGDMARRSIGRVGMTDTCSEVHGISGLEYALDTLLYGIPGLAKKVPLTHNIVNWTDVAPENGMTVTTTIDVSMQDIVENELNEALKEYEAEWGTVILMDVKTGDIKAISNLERDDDGNYIESMNHAIQRFEPGSVMKGISMAIALEDGFTTDPENEFYKIMQGYRFGGSPTYDTHSPSQLPVSRFIEYSSNIGMTQLVAPHYKNDPNAFRERVRQLGLLDRFNTGIAGEQPPYFPPLDLKAGGLSDLGRQTWGYATMFSPLYICAFYNAIANDGKFVRPRLVSKITTERGDSVIPVSYVRDRICSSKNAAILREMLHKVVYGPGGTAKVLQDKQIDIAGKTGTSRVAKDLSPEDKEKLRINPKDTTVVRPVGYEEGKYRYAFCGFFPYDDPQYTCMVLVSKPGPNVKIRNAGYISGGILMNIAKRMYSRGMLGLKPDFRTDGAPAVNPAPVLYATTDTSRDKDLMNMLGTGNARRIANTTPTPAGTVPDVSGLGLREALVVLEKAGYNIAFEGDGSVSSQSPQAGTTAAPGSVVNLILEKR